MTIQNYLKALMMPVLFTTTCLAQVGTHSPAQPPATKGANPFAGSNAAETEKKIADGQTHFFEKEFKLTKAQYDAAYKINLEFAHETGQKLAHGTNPTRQEMERIAMKRDLAMKKIMTPEQIKLFDAYHARFK